MNVFSLMTLTEGICECFLSREFPVIRYSRGVIHQQVGWHKVLKADSTSETDICMVLTQVNQCIDSTPPREKNLTADFLSRYLRDRTDSILNYGIFKAINQHWGPLEVDLLATRFSAQ